MEGTENRLRKVRIEDRGEKDILMLIEVDSRRDILIALVLFMSVVASATLAGVFGPPRDQSGMRRYTFIRGQTKMLKYAIPGISPANQFISLSLGFELSNPGDIGFDTSVEFSYIIIFSYQGTEVRREKGSMVSIVKFEPMSETSESIPFFFDQFMQYDRIELRMDFQDVAKITDAVITYRTGDERHMQLQVWLRMTFGFAWVVALTAFILRLRYIPGVSWTIEQKMSLCLGVFALIGVNPLFFVYCWWPSVLQEMLNGLVFEMLNAVCCCFVLVVLEVACDRDASAKSYFWKVAFCTFLFLVESFRIWMLPFGVAIASGGLLTMVSYMRGSLYVIFFGWCAHAMRRVTKGMSWYESFVMRVYGFMILVVIFANVVDIFAEYIPLLDNTAGVFGLRFGSLEAFSLLMIFCHWPYEYEIDGVYDDPESGDADHVNLGLMDSET